MSTAKSRGGKKGRRAKNTSNDVKRELIFKEEEQEYAQVLKMLGGGRCDLFCFDGVKRLGTIRGKLIKRVWIQTGDIVLISLRDFQKEAKKCDIVHKYFPDEAKKLKAYKEIPESVDILTGEAQETDPNFVFGDDDGSGGSGGDDDDEQPDNRRAMPVSEDSEEDEEDDSPPPVTHGKKDKGKGRKKSDDDIDDI